MDLNIYKRKTFVVVSDKSLLSQEFGVLRWQNDASFWNNYSYDEYERFTCTKRSANDIINYFARRETFTARMFATLQDAHHAVYFYREERVSRLSTRTTNPANFLGASLISRFDPSKLSLVIARVPLHSTQTQKQAGSEIASKGSNTVSTTNYVSTYKCNFTTRG